jgi:hypothetical protein
MSVHYYWDGARHLERSSKNQPPLRRICVYMRPLFEYQGGFLEGYDRM